MQINIPLLKIHIDIAPVLFVTTFIYDFLNLVKNEETFERLFSFVSTCQYSLRLGAAGGGDRLVVSCVHAQP